MRILVTGGAGYIGSICTALLRESGHEPIVYDNLSTGQRRAIPTDVPFVFGDIRDVQLLTRVMRDQKVEAVMHFAALIVAPESLERPFDYYEVNTVGGLRVLEAACAAGVGMMVISSTAAVYGNPDRNPVMESARTEPLSPYGSSKLFLERIAFDLEKAGGPRTVVLRYFNVAGAMPDLSRGSWNGEAKHLIKIASDVALGRRPVLDVYGNDYETEDGTAVRDYIHVADLASAHLSALDYLRAGGTSEVFNCGYGHGVSVQDVVDAFDRIQSPPLSVRYVPRRAGDIADIFADTTKLREKTGWEPRYDDLDFICRTALEWERKERKP